jgi:hypothetical protein
MANRLNALPNTEEEEEFLTDVDKSPPAPCEEDDTPTRRQRRIQEGLRGRWSEDEDADEDADDGAMTKTQMKSRGDDRRVFLWMVMMTRLTSLTQQKTLGKTPS